MSHSRYVLALGQSRFWWSLFSLLFDPQYLFIHECINYLLCEETDDEECNVDEHTNVKIDRVLSLQIIETNYCRTYHNNNTCTEDGGQYVINEQ